MIAIAASNCESFLHLIFDRIGHGRGSVCATGHCFDAFFRSELTETPSAPHLELIFLHSKSAVGCNVGREIAPTAAQQPLLQKLGTALAQANGYLIKSCPTEIPPLPVERLQLMDSQIDAMTVALEIVRVPLQKFEQSLDLRQPARLSALVASEDVTPVCAKNPEPANWPMPILKQALQPTTAQEAALNNLERAFNRAASGLNAVCSDGMHRVCRPRACKRSRQGSTSPGLRCKRSRSPLPSFKNN